MSTLDDLLVRTTGGAFAPGAVALLAQGDEVEVRAVGLADREAGTAMRPDSLFRIASTTKPITAAAVMILVDDGTLDLQAPVERWLPELADHRVLRTPSGPLTDTVATDRAVTVEDVLTCRAGWGFPDDFSWPGIAPLVERLLQGPPQPQAVPAPDEWMARLGEIPALYQPGQAWLYNLCCDLQGVLVARASGRTFPQFLAERIFEPLGMIDTAFGVPADKLDRFTSYYRPADEGPPTLIEPPDGEWRLSPAFASGAGGLISTAADWLAFGRMLINGGTVGDRRILSPAAVQGMITNHLSEAQRNGSTLFLQGQGWGYGGSVDVTRTDPWTVPGRYGWVGGTGTSAHIVPSTGQIAILLTQLELSSPVPPSVLTDFWTYAAS